ncbi:hypothetical protein AGDE_14140 [Angomonas deanei]|uniref:Uncharacterized protein n=1 Tax=Angomonas deanei TaxID=59799 RepID=A0A7G2CQ47_9TRYP|nr:hypothetical protein AGDE_14140 [Angomonas deanei]CAD2221948.1 hypothetical protein, conserved [Angomonas deanei]|eukprot:EPY21355.1 hypothetical protein AGDE_14140 [Angomonas deanei]
MLLVESEATEVSVWVWFVMVDWAHRSEARRLVEYPCPVLQELVMADTETVFFSVLLPMSSSSRLVSWTSTSSLSTC